MSDEVRRVVRERYARAASSGCGCGDLTAGGYSGVGEVGERLIGGSLGWGNPVALAELAAGEVVLDLGSGGGLDVLLSARRVGPGGFVYGLDMTDEMLELARHNQREADIHNVEFLRGEIEDIPLPRGSVDVVLSNCVINLSTDKRRVFAEVFRVLRAGGRLAVYDMVFKEGRESLSEQAARSAELWAGCIAGALGKGEYEELLREAGFSEVGVEITHSHSVAQVGGEGCCGSGEETSDIRISSAFIRARKPEV